MRRILLTIAICGIATVSQAQLAVVESGQVQIGEIPSGQAINSTATLNLWSLPNISSAKTAGAIAFGPGAGSVISGDGGRGTMTWKADNGFEFMSGTGKAVMTYSTLGNYLGFSSNIKAASFITTSDLRLKNNVQPLDDSFMGLYELNSVSYGLNDTDTKISSQATDDSENAKTDDSLKMDSRIRFGFIAQEVQEIYPNLVVEGENGMLGIDYTGFIPILVDAIKNLTEQVTLQQETINMLTGSNMLSMMPAGVGINDGNRTSLQQNQPNPFNTSTEIECTLADDVKSAFVCIYDMQGKQIKRIDLADRGKVSCIINASELQSGMYIYALITDGIEIDSKRMILTD